MNAATTAANAATQKLNVATPAAAAFIFNATALTTAYI